jgi:tetraacyldisaccharide 4'-kinase
VKVVGWRDVDGKPVEHFPGPRAAAFCGLGNPQTFWDTLADNGVQTVLQKTFRDHHRYTCGELERLARHARRESADCLVTTEKDWINLPRGSQQALGGMKLLWLEIGIVLDDPAEFFSLLEGALIRSRSRKNERAVQNGPFVKE